MRTSVDISDFTTMNAGVPMTVNGTVVRTAVLLLLSALAGAVGWLFLPDALLLPTLLLCVGGAIGFSIWAHTSPLNAKVPSILYALTQGLLVGAVARGYHDSYDGIVVTALLATAVTVGTSLALYATRIVRVTQKAKSIIAMLTVAAFVFYGIAAVMAVFGAQMPGLTGDSVLGYGISALMLALAVANLFSLYSTVDEAVAGQSDARFEWLAAFGITSVVLWVFLEFLRLFARSR